MEDVAYGCLIGLVERSMVQVGEYGSTGKVKTCRLHDLMRDLCLQKAKEENFLNVVDFSVGLVSNARPIGKVRRLALYLDKKSKCEFSGSDGRNGHIRSLLYFSPHYIDNCSKRVIRSVFNDFKLLKVLKFENIRREFDLPKTIGNLVHLRFLSLRWSAFRALPSSVYKLILLQTLDLRGGYINNGSCFGFYWDRKVKITNVFLHMEQLRHLYLPEDQTVSGQKLSFAKLGNLQTLVNVIIDKCNLNDLVRLTNLKKLGIIPSGSSQLEKLNDILVSESITYEHLRSLSVGVETAFLTPTVVIPMGIIVSRCPHLYKLQLVGRISELPEQLRDCPNLTNITLIYTELKDDQIKILEKLPKLRALYLMENSLESETLIFSQGGFPHLELLVLSVLVSMKEWKVENEAMPRLHRLSIEFCPKLRAIPDGLQDVTTLKELTISSMPSRFCRKVEEGGEDFYKIKHVPSLIIRNIKPDEPEMEEAAAGASRVVAGPAVDSHQELTVDAAPPPPAAADEKPEEIQASNSSTPNLPC